MGTAPTIIRLDSLATGNPADGQIHRNIVDDAFGAMASKLLIFLRASTMSPTSAAVLDALGNSFTSTGNMTKSTSDSNFNNHESITFNASTFNPYVSAAGGIGIGAAPQPMTNSFTVLAGMRCAPSSNTCLYGDNAGTSDGANKSGFYMNSTGKLSGIIGNSGIPGATSIGFPSGGQAGVVWVSYDASTSIVRAGANGPAIAYQSSALSAFHNGAGTSTVVYPFAYQTGGASGSLSFHRWALFNKAFMNGAVPGDDAQFGALINLYSNYI